jgi:hypothetical protein
MEMFVGLSIYKTLYLTQKLTLYLTNNELLRENRKQGYFEISILNIILVISLG